MKYILLILFTLSLASCSNGSAGDENGMRTDSTRTAQVDSTQVK